MPSRHTAFRNSIALLRALRLRHVPLICTVYAGLLRAQWLVWRRPTGALVESVTPVPASRDTTAVPERVARLAHLTHWGARTLPIRPVCLVRSVALTWLLARYGYPGAIVRAGVRLADGQFQAHAWVEYHEQPLAEGAEQLASFAPIATVNARAFS